MPLSQLVSQHRTFLPKNSHGLSHQDPTHNFPPITKFTVPLLPVTNHALTPISLLVHLLYPPCCTVFCFAVMLPLQSVWWVVRNWKLQLLSLCLSYEIIPKHNIVAETKPHLCFLLYDTLFQLAAELQRLAWWDERWVVGNCNCLACVWDTKWFRTTIL